MARGSAAGEGIVSQANSEEYGRHYDRLFGKTKAIRGRWIWDAQLAKLVRAEQYRPPPEARNASIIADRIHEGTVSPVDGSDVGSLRKRREHNTRNGVTDASDYNRGWTERKAAERDRSMDRSSLPSWPR